MWIEDLAGMDAEADRIIADSPTYAGSYTEIENYMQQMGPRITEVYGAAIPLDLLAQYTTHAVEWAVDHASNIYALYMIGKALKQAGRDHASERGVPSPKEFKNYLLHVEGAITTTTFAKATLTVTHKDGSVDSR